MGCQAGRMPIPVWVCRVFLMQGQECRGVPCYGDPLFPDSGGGVCSSSYPILQFEAGVWAGSASGTWCIT
jgi:hypothetical protein